MTDEQALAVIQAMKLEILRKDTPYSLYVNLAGSMIFHQTGSRADIEAEKLGTYDLVGIYNKRARLADILKDAGL